MDLCGRRRPLGFAVVCPLLVTLGQGRRRRYSVTQERYMMVRISLANSLILFVTLEQGTRKYVAAHEKRTVARISVA